VDSFMRGWNAGGGNEGLQLIRENWAVLLVLVVGVVAWEVYKRR
jgi:hypothetical protein